MDAGAGLQNGIPLDYCTYKRFAASGPCATLRCRYGNRRARKRQDRSAPFLPPPPPPREPASLSLSSSDSPVLPLSTSSLPLLPTLSFMVEPAAAAASLWIHRFSPSAAAAAALALASPLLICRLESLASSSSRALVRAQAPRELSRHRRIINSFCTRAAAVGAGVWVRGETELLDYGTLLRFTTLKNAFFADAFYCDSRGLR